MINNAEENNQVNRPPTVSRRQFLRWGWRGAAGLVCVELFWMLGSLLKFRRKNEIFVAQEQYVDAGLIDSFVPGSVTAVPAGQFYLSRQVDGSLLALSKTCTHLGCSVPWDAQQQKFICPCHGSSFNGKGEVLTGPALRPLDYYTVRIENGLVRVNIAQTHKRDSFNAEQTTTL